MQFLGTARNLCTVAPIYSEKEHKSHLSLHPPVPTPTHPHTHLAVQALQVGADVLNAGSKGVHVEKR